MKLHPATHGAIVSSANLGTFHLTEACYERETVVPIHDHDRSGWTLTLDGTYTERFPQREYVAPAGSVLGKPAAARHSNRYGPRGARCFLIGVETEHPATHRGFARALRKVSFYPQGPVPAIVRRMHREFTMRDAAWPLVLEGLILELAANAVRLTVRAPRRPAPRWLVRVREQLDAAFTNTPRFAELAATAGVHPVHLSRAFHATYGASPGEYLREIRIDHAKQLLGQSTVPISQVAAASGFCDQSHLSRAFRKATGMTPTVFRLSQR
jgi:AraC family transcriptional regulator